MWLSIKELWRSKKSKPFSFLINILGMTLAFSAVIIMFVYVQSEYKHDRNVKNRDNIIRVKNYTWAVMPGAYASWLSSNLPEIEKYCRVMMLEIPIQVPEQYGVKEFFSREKFLIADESYPEMFSLNVLEGDRTTPLATMQQIMISQKMAKKLFGNSDPLGKEIILSSTKKAIISAIFEDIENTALKNPELIINLDYINKEWEEGYTESWGSSNFETYFQLVPGTNLNELENKYKDLYVSRLKAQGTEEEKIKDAIQYLTVQPFNDIYFSQEMDFSNHGNRSDVNIMLLVGLLVLIVSIINYVNITTAKVAEGARTIGIKRTLGASRTSLILSVILDALFTCFVAMILAYFVVWGISPFIAEWLGSWTTLNMDFSTLFILMIIVPLVCGIFAGIFPAIYIRRINKMESLNSQMNESVVMRNIKSGLMVLQFAVSLGLISSIFFIGKQIHYVKNIDPGYNMKDVVVVQSHGTTTLMRKFDEFRSVLLQNPSIQKVAAAKEPIYNIGERGSYINTPGGTGRENSNITWINEYFIDLVGLTLVEGIAYTENRENNRNKFLMNEEMAKKLKAEQPDAYYLDQNQIGVVKNFNFKPLYTPIEPMAFGYLDARRMGDVYIKVSSINRESTLAYIEQTYKQIFPNTFYQYSFMEDDYKRMYGSEDLLLNRLTGFTIISIVISCMGLLAFVVFYIAQQTKSIGVRKVMGATEIQVMQLLNKGFILRMLIAFVITCPIVYFIMKGWISDFAYKTTLSSWVFMVSFIFLLFFALLTVSFFTWRAATANPVDSIKSE